ncbi:MAG TPA: hypothetical protein DEO56_01155 [Nitrosomonas nitrosa]|nr:hypothetical protein [Nitrosomonas nitrosa]
MGNILGIHDRTPESGIDGSVAGIDQLDRKFTYDAIYRLRSATGRECDRPSDVPWEDKPRCTDLTRTRSYTEEYFYDLVGNVEQLKHLSNGAGFTREFDLVAGNNRLSKLSIGATDYGYQYDANGNMTEESTSRHFEWDWADRMKVFRTQAEDSEPTVHAHYLYDSGGQRVKKLVRKGNLIEVTVYIDGIFEYQRIVQGGTVEQNNTLHVMDNQSRIALVRVGNAFAHDATPPVKYHLGDHLGSSNVVIDDSGNWVNREEYTPYGETSFGSFARKRYRFTGKERDEESSFYYHEARYYAPWLGRWISCDPAGMVDGVNLYVYVLNNPLKNLDNSGLQTEEYEGPTPLEENEQMSRADLHVAGPPPPKTVVQDEPKISGGPSPKLTGSAMVNGQPGFLGENIPDTPIYPVEPKPKKDAEEVPCFSDYVRAVGAPVGSCDGPKIVAEATLGLKAPRLVAYLIMAQAKDERDPRLVMGVMSFALTPPDVGNMAKRSLGSSSGHPYAYRVLPGGTGTAFAGHGSLKPGAGTITVPEGTYITLPGEGIDIRDKTARFIEAGNWKAIAKAYRTKSDIATDIEGMATYLPGSQVPNYTLSRPTEELRIYRNSSTFESDKSLNQLLRPNMGCVQWAACTPR